MSCSEPRTSPRPVHAMAGVAKPATLARLEMAAPEPSPSSVLAASLAASSLGPTCGRTSASSVASILPPTRSRSYAWRAGPRRGPLSVSSSLPPAASALWLTAISLHGSPPASTLRLVGSAPPCLGQYPLRCTLQGWPRRSTRWLVSFCPPGRHLGLSGPLSVPSLVLPHEPAGWPLCPTQLALPKACGYSPLRLYGLGSSLDRPQPQVW